MKMYADASRYRNRQIAGDVSVAAWVGLWTWVGLRVNALVERLATPGETIERAGGSFAGTLGSVSRRISELPVVGATLREPFDAAAGAGRVLQSAGADQQEVVHALAVWLGVLFAVIPIGYVLYRYVPDRLRWVREAEAARGLSIDRQDLKLFALRAIGRQPLYELRRAVGDPAGAYDDGDYEALASLELAALGLRVPGSGRA